MADHSSIQRIARLTPLRDVLDTIESRVGVVAPQKSALASALGCTLAEDVVAAQLPPAAIALRDGFAVESAAIADAGPYAPVVLTVAAQRIDAGAALTHWTDAVLPLDAVALRGVRAEAIAAVTSGEGVLAAGGDATPERPLRRAGERLRSADIAVMTAAGIDEVTVRMPRVRIARGSGLKSPLIAAALAMIARAATAAGAAVIDADHEPGLVDQALADDRADLVIAIGGTGSGRRDASVHALARLGRVEMHGIAVSPGETAAFGFAGERSVLLMPGRLDAALAVWLLIGRLLLAKLAGGGIADTPAMLPLKRKISSTIGLAELIPVRCIDAMAEPLASGYLSFEALTRSDGWTVVPADSEGFVAGTLIAVNPWP